jgi:hypothetical protein
MNEDSVLRWRTAALVYQASDWACFIKALELNHCSIYAELVIAQAKSTP